MTLTPENELDPRSEASMTLVTLTRELKRQERISDCGHTSYTKASARRQATALRVQIAAHKTQHGIA